MMFLIKGRGIKMDYKIHIAFGFHVNCYHSYRGDTNDEQGFEKAVKIYSGFNNVAEKKIEQIRAGFLVRESLCMLRVEQTRIAKDLLKKSVAISPEKTQAAVANLEADNAEKEFLAKIAAENLK